MTNVKNNTIDERYRCGPLLRWRQGPDSELVHFQLARTSRRMSALMANALDSWTEFLSVEEAVGRMAKAPHSVPLDDLRSTIHELIESGCLVSRSRIAMDCAESGTAAPARAIGWLAIPTANRALSLERAICSYEENIRQFGRTCGILISDDSQDANDREASIRILAGHLHKPGISFWYTGIEERMAFARHLARKGDIPPATIRFGLFGSDHSPRTLGANRNAILLQTFGSMFLSVDDDTVCNFRTAPGTRGCLSIPGHLNIGEAWCFREQSAALSFGDPAALDFIGEHQTYLGKRVQSVLPERSPRQETGSLDQICVHLLSSIVAGRARICVTYNGARGDSALHSDLGQVCNTSPATKARVHNLGTDYLPSLASRQIARQALCPTISHIEAESVGMFMGIDNRLPVPAYMPDCRNSDGVFANVLARTSEHYYAAHLPFMLEHQPPEARTYAADRDSRARVSDLIICCLSTWRTEPGENDPIKRASALGRYFCQLGALPAGDFDELAHVLMCARICERIEMLERSLAEEGDKPRHWADDLTMRIEALRRATDDPEFFVPIDLPISSDEQPRRVAQGMVARYGQLLEWWPAILERTNELREAGVVIGRCLSGSDEMERFS